MCYLLPGWVGTTSDSKIIKDVLNWEDRLHTFEGNSDNLRQTLSSYNILQSSNFYELFLGKYNLVDVGFMLTAALLTPYRVYAIT